MTRSDPDRDPPVSQQRAEEVLSAVAPEWLTRQGVISVEVARRWIDGAPTNEIGIRVTIEQKLPAHEVPEGELFPDEVDGVPVDLQQGNQPRLEGPV